MPNARTLLTLSSSLLWWVAGAALAADEPNYAPTDDDLKTVLLDSSPNESFLGVQVDSLGRVFVGGREALFVYEPRPDGGYEPRRELVRFPEHTWIYDIAIRGNDLYVLTVSALYVIPDAVTRRTGLAPRRLVWGVPMGHVHQCFHGMTLGPEGDIYFAMGDPLWYYGDFTRPDHWGHWTFFSQPEGSATPYNGVGGVFRCRPDGSAFRVVARGLRNSCGLAFDRHWNLFSNDNDHEGMPAAYVPGRLVHVTPHAYFSWPRGWLLSKTPERADMLETMNDTLGRYVPVGQAYYDDAYLPARLRNNLLVARWCIRSITRYPIVERGASFQAEEFHLLDGRDQARPVNVTVGRGGRIFATICYMAQNEGSPVYRSDLVMLTRKDDPPAAPFDAYEAATATEDKLWAELADPSWSRRFRAHQELLRRGPAALAQAADRFKQTKPGEPVREHLIWLLAATGEQFGRGDDLERFARLQAIRVRAEATDRKSDRTELDFDRDVNDSDPQAQLAGLIARWDGPKSITSAVLDGPARSGDTYLRQAATLLLAEHGTLEQIESLCKAEDAPGRLAGVLAAGFRLTLPPVNERLPLEVKLDRLREEAAYVIQYADAKVDLRKLGPVGNYTVADLWKQAPHTPEQEQLFGLLLARLADPDNRVRMQAVHFLSLLNDPRSEPQVAAVVEADEERRLGVAPPTGVLSAWLAGPFDDGDEGFSRAHGPENGLIDLAQSYAGSQGPIAWQPGKTTRVFHFGPLLASRDRSSCYAYFRLESGVRQRAHLLLGSDDGVKVWQNGRLVWTNDVVRGALPHQDLVKLNLEPGSNDFLVRVRNVAGESALYVSYRTLAKVAATLPEKSDVASLAERLAAASPGGDYVVPPEFLQVDWVRAAREGNVEQGRKLFEAIGCAKCHAVSNEAPVAGGPSLADAARRFTTAHLVESVLLPNKQISPVFRATLVVTTDGRQFTGLVVAETSEKLELLLPDTKRVTLAKREIETQELRNLSPMPQGVVKKPDELRDLLAYLLSR